MMAQIVYFKEWLIVFYKKHVDVVLPVLKLVFAFFTMCMFQGMFPYNMVINKPGIFLVLSAAQAFLPISVLYYMISILIMINLWKVSMDIFLGFVIFSIICSLAFVRVDRKHAVILIVTAVMFYLKLEYLLPVLLGMIVGFGAILPAAAGVVVYFLSVYMTDVSTLLTTSSSSSFGMGLQRIVNLMLIDKKLLVFLITFSLIIFITTLLCHLFYERAWLFAIFIGHIAMILLLLFGRLIFELDYKIWRLFLEMILGIGCCYIYRFFRGIGDVSRIEKASFEDDEYFYYVKAVPKIKVTQKDRNVTDIKSGENEDDILFDDITEETDLFDGNREEAGQFHKVIEKYLYWLSLPSIGFTDILEIIIISVIVYQMLKWVQLTRAWTLFKGIIMLLLFALFAAIFQLNTISWLLSNSLGVGITAAIIIFQPELRRALEQLGRKKIFSNLFSFSTGEYDGRQSVLTEKTINEIVRASYEMGAVKTGALMVIEQNVALGEYVRTGISIDGIVSSQLLINIFEHNTPLHDGAVIIRGNRIVSATCYLPLTDSMDIGKELGTRHRAAVGISEVSDSLTIIVSEETGAVSLAKDGNLYKHLKKEELLEKLKQLKIDEENNTDVFKKWKDLLRNEKSEK